MINEIVTAELLQKTKEEQWAYLTNLIDKEQGRTYMDVAIEGDSGELEEFWFEVVWREDSDYEHWQVEVEKGRITLPFSEEEINEYLCDTYGTPKERAKEAQDVLDTEYSLRY